MPASDPEYYLHRDLGIAPGTHFHEYWFPYHARLTALRAAGGPEGVTARLEAAMMQRWQDIPYHALSHLQIETCIGGRIWIPGKPKSTVRSLAVTADAPGKADGPHPARESALHVVQFPGADEDPAVQADYLRAVDRVKDRGGRFWPAEVEATSGTRVPALALHGLRREDVSALAVAIGQVLFAEWTKASLSMVPADPALPPVRVGWTAEPRREHVRVLPGVGWEGGAWGRRRRPAAPAPRPPAPTGEPRTEPAAATRRRAAPASRDLAGAVVTLTRTWGDGRAARYSVMLGGRRGFCVWAETHAPGRGGQTAPPHRPCDHVAGTVEELVRICPDLHTVRPDTVTDYTVRRTITREQLVLALRPSGGPAAARPVRPRGLRLAGRLACALPELPAQYRATVGGDPLVTIPGSHGPAFALGAAAGPGGALDLRPLAPVAEFRPAGGRGGHTLAWVAAGVLLGSGHGERAGADPAVLCVGEDPDQLALAVALWVVDLARCETQAALLLEAPRRRGVPGTVLEREHQAARAELTLHLADPGTVRRVREHLAARSMTYSQIRTVLLGGGSPRPARQP